MISRLGCLLHAAHAMELTDVILAGEHGQSGACQNHDCDGPQCRPRDVFHLPEPFLLYRAEPFRAGIQACGLNAHA
jgi:hypothetical protein